MGEQDGRTEKPTPKRITRAHEDGQVIRSTEVSQAVSLAVFITWTSMSGAAALAGLMTIVRNGITAVGRPEDQGKLVDDFFGSLYAGTRVMFPLMIGLLVLAVFNAWLQGGFHPKKGVIKFDLARLNPVTGMKRFFAMEKLIEAAKAVLRTAFYAMIALAVVLPEWSHVTGLARMTPAGILETTARIAGRVLSRALMVSLCLAAADYALTRYRFYQGLRMSKQEIRDEAKENENPEIKGRIRGKQREIARRRMMASIRTANVVVTNPTHIAVAMKYDRVRMFAPIVVAKGHDLVALRIREEAKKYDIPIVEDPPLARMLDRLCPINSAVPEALYRAVAEVFAYVFKQRRGIYRQHPEVETAAEPAGARA